MTVGIVEHNRDETGAVRISFPQRRVTLPSSEEVQKLLAIVIERWPQLRRANGAEFVVAFHRLALLGRRSKLDAEHGLDFWTSDVRTWQQQHQIATHVFVDGAAFTAAVVAHGIPYAPLTRFPFDLGFGIVPYGGGVPSNNQWKSVLDTGQLLLEPTLLGRPTELKSPVRVQQIALNWKRV